MTRLSRSSSSPLTPLACSLTLLMSILCGSLLAPLHAQAKDATPLDFAQLMKLNKIYSPVISDDGEWIAYERRPGRGDGELVVQSADGKKTYRAALGAAPVFSPDGRWVAAKRFLTLEVKESDEEDKPETGMILVATDGGDVVEFDEVRSWAFSSDSGSIIYLLHPEDEEDEDAGDEEESAREEPESSEQASEADEEDEEDEDEREVGGTLVVRNLADGSERRVEFVDAFVADESAPALVYAVATADGAQNGIWSWDLASGVKRQLHGLAEGAYTHPTFSEEGSRLAFLAGLEVEEGTITDAELYVGRADAVAAVSTEGWLAEGWEIPAKNELRFSRAGERLFFGTRPAPAEEAAESEAGEGDDAGGADAGDEAEEGENGVEGSEGPPFDPYDFDAILAKREVDVWHWDDPRIKPHERENWDDEKDRVYTAVLHTGDGRIVQLGDETLEDVQITECATAVLGASSMPYLQFMTWEGWFRDVYRVDMHSGERQLVGERLYDKSSLSAGGRYVVWFDDDDWFLFDAEAGTARNLTAEVDAPFGDEDHDYPRPRDSYGVGGWVEGDTGVFLYDKYDIWYFPTAGGDPYRLTEGEGRENMGTFRILDLDPDVEALAPDQELFLHVVDESDMGEAFYRARVGEVGVVRLRAQDKRLRNVVKAEDAARLLHTEESYTEFPDLWVSDLDLGHNKRLSDANPELRERDLGSAELVEWNSLDGIPLQGVLIKPPNYDPKKRYPVLVYFYRFFSHRLHSFNEPVVNHRPSFYVYATDGYCVFLPDIRFEIGRPGFATTKCLVPGVQKLVDMGIADKDAIGLHGHSWSGYTSAFVLTQTDVFAACVSGAPVSNMTSAYGGIRWGSGMARQFQYEQSQSRLGGSLWEYPERYIENSTLFYADRIETPLLIQHGDVDEAVPWYQSIELYLAMRRLRKPCVFLQYRDEPHHLKKVPNQLDYSIKMKEFFDHFLKGSPAPGWWTEGVAFEGE